MPTTRFMTTVLPYSVDKDDTFHLSLFFSHRLDGGGKLSDYKAMINWVKTLNSGNVIVKLSTTPAGANPIGHTLLLDKTDQDAWDTAFPGTTKVRDYPKPKVTEANWNSFAAHKMDDYARAVHYGSTLCTPVERPSVLGSPVAGAVFEVLRGVKDAAAAIDELSGIRTGYAAKRARRLADLEQQRTRAANAGLKPSKPDPEDPTGSPAIAAAAAPPQPWRSPIELLLERQGLDTKITDYLDEKPVAGVPPSPGLTLMRDLQSAYSYYERREAQFTPIPSPTAAVGPERAQREPPDFHERAAAACNIPALARKLGLVVDVKVDEDDLATLAAADHIWCDVDIDADDVEKYLSPQTLCHTEGKRFYAVPADDSQWHVGRMRIGNPERYRVLDLDPDAAALALEQHLRSSIRALAIAVNGDRGSYAPAALRATGFAVAELDRSDRLKKQVKKSETLEPVVETPDTPQQRETFRYEGLLRGTRVEVWDDFTRVWHSLHDRTVTASFTRGGSDNTIFTDVPDPGMLQNTPLSRTPGSAQNPYYVHEVLAGWDGWHLSAPRPGKIVVHNATDHVDPEAERLADEPESVDGLSVRSTAMPNSQPALRYGRKYSFRIAGVDLAGNSVPTDMVLPTTAKSALVSAAATHLDKLRAEATARDDAGFLEHLRNSGTLPCYPPDDVGTRADVERATASVVKHAPSLTLHPQWDVTAELLAQLSADADEPETVTAPRQFLRWDPIPAPTLVPRTAYTTGESLQRMVIRTGLTGGPGMCQRHIVPPKGSELEAEQDGRFDELMRTGKQRRAYAIALKERGNLFHTSIQDLDNPRGSVPQPGVRLLSMPGVVGGKTLDQIQDPEVAPDEGQYNAHDVNNLVLPYLPDVMANGVALVFYEAGADHVFSNPRVLQSVFVPYDGAWPELQSLRLVLHSAPRLDAQKDGNVINIGLPPGEQVAMRLSTTLDDEHLKKMGLWVNHPANGPSVPDADRDVLADAARNGWMWWLTPDEELRLVHATARPAVAPRLDRLTARLRTRGVVAAALDGVLDIHGASTDKVELRAQWTERIDDPAAPTWTQRTTTEMVADYRINESERYSLLTVDGPTITPADQVGSRTVAEPIRKAIHNLPDTKARKVIYRLHGSSRYREFFTPDQLPPTDDAESAGNQLEVNIPSSARPAPPVVHDVIPMFKWEQTTEPEHPFAVRRIRRSGLRIWLDRPWYSSGDGEMLAVITTGDPELAGVTPDTVSVWARDPILVGPAMSYSYEVPILPAWQQRAVQLRLAPETLPGHPAVHVVRQGPRLSKDRDKVVNAYAYVPEFDSKRKRWFVDVILDSTSAVWPFLRLAVARYQPNSIPGEEFSEIVTTDFTQLPPERVGTLSRPDSDHVRVSVSGVTALTSAPGVELTPTPTQPQLVDLLAKTRTVLASLQARNSASGIEWVTLDEKYCEVVGADTSTFNATWSAAISSRGEQLRTPATSDVLRVQVEEYELLSADPDPGSADLVKTRRLVYADHFYL